MKKSELKSLLKPMIKECIKEVIFEEGILSNIVSEVAQGLGGSTLVEAQHVPATETTPAPAQLQEQEKRASVAKHKAELLAAINKESYGGIDIFEGTNPLSSGGSVEKITPKNRHENADRMIRRFIKRTKKIKLMDELRDRRYYVKPSEIKRTTKRRQIAENKKRVRQEKAILLEEPNYNRKKKTRR